MSNEERILRKRIKKMRRVSTFTPSAMLFSSLFSSSIIIFFHSQTLRGENIHLCTKRFIYFIKFLVQVGSRRSEITDSDLEVSQIESDPHADQETLG